MRQAGLQGKRWGAISTVALTIYAILGSYMFGEWWYGFFWDGGYRRLQYISDGLEFLLDHEFRLTLYIILALLFTVVAGFFLRRQLFSFTDKFGWLIIVCSLITASADAVTIRHTEGEAYRLLVRLNRAFGNVGGSFFQQLQTLTNPPKIEPPIYFHYLDANRVEALYNELLPDLVVRQHEITGSSSVKGKAEAGTGGASVGLEAGSDRGSKSVFAPAEFSSDRKCLEVMKYVQEKWPAKYYTSDLDWVARRAFAWVGPASALAAEHPEEMKDVLPTSPSDPEVARKQEELKQQLWKLQLKTELVSVGGMVFVDGNFDEAITRNGAILTLKFSDQMVKCSFRISIPKDALRALPSVKPLHLRIFGDVTRPLTDGLVDVKAVAVF